MLKRSILYWVLLLPLIVVILFPFAVMLTTALKPFDEIFKFPPRWLPSHLEWRNFADMWSATKFGGTLLNSLLVSALTTLLALLVSAPAAYALARFNFSGRDGYQQFLLLTQMFSPIVLVIGLFRLIVKLGMVDSLFALVLIYAVFNIAFSIWMLRSYFQTLAPELEEAAWIDGANRVQSLVYIFLPLALPAITVVALFAFIFSWNEFVLALTLLRSAEKHTLTLAVFSLVGGRYTVEWNQVMAAALCATLPAAAVFIYLQRYLIRGLGLGGFR